MKALSMLLVFITFLSFEAEANPIRIFTPGTIKKMLGPYPKAGSEGEKQDFNVLLEYQRTRSASDCEIARLEEDANLITMFAGPRGPLTKAEAKKLNPFFLTIYAEAGANIYLAKKIYKRPRPYVANPEIVPCIDKESSYAYPSGHTAMARLFARLLSRMYPDRAKAFLERGDEVALNRIIGGVHHPTDIVSGKKLGDALDREVETARLMQVMED